MVHTLCQRKETEERAQLEWRNQVIPRGMRFTNADPRYASKDDDKQVDDTIMIMNRVRQTIFYNAELNNDITWLCLTLEQMGFHQSTGGAEEGVRRDERSD